MDLNPFFKSVLEQDTAPIVICDLQHTIIYMNPVAVARYARRGGAELIGRCLLDCHAPQSVDAIRRVVAWFAADVSHNQIYTYSMARDNADVYMVALRDGDGTLIGYYEKHVSRDRETAAAYDFTA